MDPLLDFPHMYRLQRAASTEDLPDGAVEKYTVLAGPDGAAAWEFLFSKKSMAGTTTVTQTGNGDWRLEGSAGLGGMSWEVFGDGTAKGFLKAPSLTASAWRAQVGTGAEFQMQDATKLKDKVLRNVLNGWPDAYHLMRENQIIGYICREERNPKQATGWLGKVKRLFADLTGS